MEEHVEKIPVYISAGKVILAAVSPAQRLLQTPAVTHHMINRQAKVILCNDGYKDYAEIADEFSPHMDKGVSWADEGFKNMSHFYNPHTLKGIFGWVDAVREGNLFWNKAVYHWNSNDYEKCFFYLGALVHLLQDLCVPHHAIGVLFDGHRDYEDWVKSNKEKYAVNNSGQYGLAKAPGDWLRFNASTAIRYYSLVRAGCTQKHYHRATSMLLPRAQKSTAGFLHYFFSTMGI